MLVSRVSISIIFSNLYILRELQENKRVFKQDNKFQSLCAYSSISLALYLINFFSDHTHLFAQLIARTAKDIEVLIDSLPSEESSAELQSASLLKLEEENKEASQRLEDIVQQVREKFQK